MTEKLKKNVVFNTRANVTRAKPMYFELFLNQRKVRVRSLSQFRHKQSRIRDTQSNNHDATVTQSQPLVLSNPESAGKL
jgi:hypothetical protein